MATENVEKKELEDLEQYEIDSRKQWEHRYLIQYFYILCAIIPAVVELPIYCMDMNICSPFTTSVYTGFCVGLGIKQKSQKVKFVIVV